MTSSTMKRFLGGAALLALPLATGAAGAQTRDVQAYGAGIPGATAYREDASNALARHIRTLAASPRNLIALLGAANAALEVGDLQAALAFFGRAEEVAPRDGRVKAGMGSAFVQTEQPQAALKFFAEAVSLGVPAEFFAKDRGLAYDMIGAPAQAQADYALALQHVSDPEVQRRMALSKAISGDRDGALAILEPQLRRQDRGAWRARAFVLALTGDTKGAVKAVEAAMPGSKAQMEPFLARLPHLSAADRAMAVHFGRFPRNIQVASVSPGVLYSAPPIPSATAAGRPDPSQPAFGSATVARKPPSRVDIRAPIDDRMENSEARARRIPTSSPLAVAPSERAAVAPPPAFEQPRPVVERPPAIVEEPQPIAMQQEIAGVLFEPVAAASNEASGPPGPRQEIATAELQPSAPVNIAPSPQPAAKIVELDFAAVAAAIAALPSNEIDAAIQLAQADVKEPRKPAAKPAPDKPAPARKAAEAAPPSEPSRIWVQLAAARDKKAFPDEFRRLKSKAPKLLDDRTAWTTPLRSTNRLLIGPFKTAKEAGDLVNLLSKAQISSYSWTSEAGQAIEKLSAR
jgi:Flp pilus assembly protein TadD